MDCTDIISILLGVISVLLGIWSIYQSYRYRKLDKKIKDLDDKINTMQTEKQNEIYIITRHTLNLLNDSKIRLKKDIVAVLITDKYKPRQEAVVIEKLQKILPDILKKCYIDHLISVLVTENNFDEPVYLTLRHEYTTDDLKKIHDINTQTEPLGLHFEYVGNKKY